MSAKEFIRCCPFCGSHEVQVCRTNQRACWIQCEHCDGETESAPTRGGAIELWNRRHFDEQPAVIVEDMDKEDKERRRGK